MANVKEVVVETDGGSDCVVEFSELGEGPWGCVTTERERYVRKSGKSVWGALFVRNHFAAARCDESPPALGVYTGEDAGDGACSGALALGPCKAEQHTGKHETVD